MSESVPLPPVKISSFWFNTESGRLYALASDEGGVFEYDFKRKMWVKFSSFVAFREFSDAADLDSVEITSNDVKRLISTSKS
ncbi:hypothetical protein HEFE104084_08095 [Helicobacter felis]